jgi:hypothetical protein
MIDIRTLPGFSPAMTADQRIALYNAEVARRKAEVEDGPSEGMTWCTRCGKVQVPAATSIDIDPVCADCYLIISTRE